MNCALELEDTALLITDAAKMVLALHAIPTPAGRGSTVSLTAGNIAGLSFYVVSAHPQRSVELIGEPTFDALFLFIALNLDLLILPGYAIGTWFDRDRKLHVLDVVRCISSLYEAIHLGMLHGQRAIFDLKANREISLVAAYRNGSWEGRGL